MSREIKFRAWDGYRFTKAGISFNNTTGEMMVTRGDVLEQFTGLKDSRGKEIYEGDIVKFRSHPEKTRTMKVEYNSDLARFQVFDADGWHTFQHYNSIEVIGNVHENPELLS